MKYIDGSYIYCYPVTNTSLFNGGFSICIHYLGNCNQEGRVQRVRTMRYSCLCYSYIEPYLYFSRNEAQTKLQYAHLPETYIDVEYKMAAHDIQTMAYLILLITCVFACILSQVHIAYYGLSGDVPKNHYDHTTPNVLLSAIHTVLYQYLFPRGFSRLLPQYRY